MSFSFSTSLEAAASAVDDDDDDKSRVSANLLPKFLEELMTTTSWEPHWERPVRWNLCVGDHPTTFAGDGHLIKVCKGKGRRALRDDIMNTKLRACQPVCEYSRFYKNYPTR